MEREWSDPGYAAVAAEVGRRTGLVFGPARRVAVERGIRDAMDRAHVAGPDAYLSRLARDDGALDDLVAEITVGETYFFREPAQFDLIRHQVIADLLRGRPRARALRMWSAGCATGEEPYTLAIVLRELGLEGAAHIVASDLSRAALARARRAVYGAWSLRGVPDQVVRTCFERVGDRFILEPALRDAVEFRYLNLAEDTYPSLGAGIWGMDLILCRNVLIYFSAETIARVARRLIDSLSDDGWLLLGASDPALADLVPCDVIVTRAGLAYRRSTHRAIRPATSGVATSPLPGPPPPLPVAAPKEESPSVVPAAPAPEGAADAVRWYGEHCYDRAADLAGRLLQRDGGDPALWVVLVRALANRGTLEAAGRACAAALDRHRTSAELTYLHAVLLAEAGRHADAALAARRALYLDRGLVVAHLTLGGALVRLGDANGARRAFRNAELLLAAMAPADVVPASDGEPAGRLARIARMQGRFLGEAAA